jgi:nicotinate-nucleotide adenylyltransferase
MNRIGIFGGSFNPPHVGHLILGERVMEMLKLDKLIFIPAYIPPHKKKQHIIDPIHRLNMLKLAISGKKYFEISDIEIKRGGTSYTYDTLVYLTDRYENSKFFLIIGWDNYRDFSKWKNYESIFDLCDVAVLKRINNGSGINPHTKHMINDKKKETGFSECDCLPDHIVKSRKGSFIFLDTPLLDITSTEIRRRIRLEKPCDYFVTEKVKKYIEKNGLYK